MSADRCRQRIKKLLLDGGAVAMLGAHEELVSLCRVLSASNDLAKQAVAELLADHVFDGKQRLWQEVRIQFGSEQEAAGVPASFIRHPWEEANLDAEEQQRLFARALVKHRQTVKWIYKVSLILDNRVQNDAHYHTWRTAEDKFRAAVDDLARHIDMVVLARALL